MSQPDAAGPVGGSARQIVEPGAGLCLHLHKVHSETFYILDGEVEFIVGGERTLAVPGTTVHVPAGIGHHVRSAVAARMLMLYCPAGFEKALAAMRQLTDEQGRDADFMRQLNERFDIFFL